MKAITYYKYGSPDSLKLEEIEKPIPKDNEVLVRVKAASINSWDWDMLTGIPRLYQLISGIGKPKHNILGSDIAGTVEAVGKKVKKYKPGDEVYGDMSVSGFGAFAEYKCAKESALEFKSPKMTFEQAAAVPQGGGMAMQGIMDYVKLSHESKVLIIAAGGSVGTYAIQLAKIYGAEVTAIDTAEKSEWLKSIGADYTIDYKKEDFSKQDKKYDLIIDNISIHSIYDYKRTLSKHGRALIVGGKIKSILQAGLIAPFISKKNGEKLGILAQKANKDLDVFNKLFEEGKVKPYIDKTFLLEKLPEAFSYYASGKFRGKIVITM